jgi:hypothetical protein
MKLRSLFPNKNPGIAAGVLHFSKSPEAIPVLRSGMKYAAPRPGQAGLA